MGFDVEKYRLLGTRIERKALALFNYSNIDLFSDILGVFKSVFEDREYYLNEE